ncbi:hypothetical protein D0Y65_015499 [Glycine soja]|uniref:AIPP2-like SPOC-like domain-containing protein n=1 Tax=Glycine soja TaxID=3848 RepID=A0A445KDE5_GLYSO|nr:hypothetical protein D0Y65_015499 [Glycine soja]
MHNSSFFQILPCAQSRSVALNGWLAKPTGSFEISQNLNGMSACHLFLLGGFKIEMTGMIDRLEVSFQRQFNYHDQVPHKIGGGKTAVTYDIMAPSPVVGSSFKLVYQQILDSQAQLLEGKEYHKIQNPTVETNDHPHAPADSNIYTQPEDVSSDSAARALRQPKVGYCKICEVHLPYCKTLEMHNQENSHQRMLKLYEEIQRLKTSNVQIPNSQKNLVVLPKTVHISGKNGHPQKNMSSEASILKHKNYLKKGMGLTCEIPAKGPEVKPRDNSGAQGHGFKQNIRGLKIGKSSFKLQSQRILASQTPVSEHKEHAIHIGTESQLSKDTADCENQSCTDEKNNQLLPSIVAEFNSPSGSSTNTPTTDECSKAEQRIEILTHQSGTTQLSQVAVCLQCGNAGFPETLVFCNKCQVYARHRYCLDGPVIFTDDVTWFCEDCEAKVTSFHDSCTLLPSGKNISLNSGNDASQARIEPKSCIESVKNKQEPQNIIAKTMVLLSDNHSLSHHGLSQCINNAEKENKFEKEFQPDPKDEANTSESLNATVPYPIADPVWRGSLRISDPSFGTVIGLLAHVSTLASPKVLEETRFFPDVLCPDLRPRTAVWPKSFMKCGPNMDSIALYFFPDSERVERAFHKLVEDMMYFDLSLRTEVENAELLIFPSILLPIQCRRFQEKYYLWGVFRAKKPSL